MKNIVYLHTHDTGRCIAPYGYAVDTPALDRFAGESVLFRRAFDCGPTCSPARASLLTGQYPHKNGMLGLVHRGSRLKDTSRHLANFLKNHGYHTVLCGIQHEHNCADELGYLEEHQATPASPDNWQHRDESVTTAACNFLNQQHEKPFFLSLGLFATHRVFPRQYDPEDRPDRLRPPPPIPDVPEARYDWAVFRTMLRHADHCFGQVLDTLDATGHREDTLVLITTDHGTAFPGMKCTLSDHGCGVMFMLRIPDIAGDRVTEALSSHLDFYPTVCDWLEIDTPADLDGISLLPLLRGEVKDIREAVFSEINYHAARDIQRSVRTERFRYVRRYDDYPGVVLPNIDNSPTKQFLYQQAEFAKWPRIPSEQLFDLYRDPTEACSRLNAPAYSQNLEELRQLLDNWMHQTDDPLLIESLSKPDNFKLNRQAGREPDDNDWE